jgi:sigma-B regulation protein RsbU (phosphoserine phosphatase)
MLELRDFLHLPQVESLFGRLVQPQPGVILVAGWEPHPSAPPPPEDGFLPSGRLMIFRILCRRFLSTNSRTRAIVVASDRDTLRTTRAQRHRTTVLAVRPPLSYEDLINEAVKRNPGLLAIDRFEEAAADTLRAAKRGIPTIAQFDSIFAGRALIQQILDSGVPQESLSWLKWVVAVSRVRTLCPHCKAPYAATAEQLVTSGLFPPGQLGRLDFDVVYGADGCPDCQYTGRAGEAIVFDIQALKVDPKGNWQLEECLTRAQYMMELAAGGFVAWEDVCRIDATLLRQTFNMLVSSERLRAQAHDDLQRKIAQLEVANQVLQARTEALISLHDIGQSLTTSLKLEAVARRVCRYTHGLCGADRAVLYYLRPDNTAEIIAVAGWDRKYLRQRVTESELPGAKIGKEPATFSGWPPGIPQRHPDVEGAALRAGLRVPLMAHGTRVGMMIVHSTSKRTFNPGEVALLQTFANQAAVALQRAGLIQQLHEKIDALEAAQAELVEMERMAHEMELARHVQQSVLPRVFPALQGYTFAARNQPARQVGGDFYDVIRLPSDRLGLVIADVSDKGMPAALYMALTRSLILAEARRSESPRQVLTSVHNLLLELGEPDMFVTVFYGVIDGPSRRLTYVRAGHDRPILLRNGQDLSLGGEGIFLGLAGLDALHLSEEKVDLKAGDRLVLYTDGLIDILSTQQTSYGLARLKTLLRESANMSAEQLCDVVFDVLNAFRGDALQYDDMTMLVAAIE